MDFRKIIEFGNNSYIISLPKSWILSNNLGKGDIVAIEEKKSEILISTNKEISKEPLSLRVNITNLEPASIQSQIVSAYKSGYDLIELYSEALAKSIPAIKTIAGGLAGFEIVNQSEKSVVLQDLMNIQEVYIRQLMRRMDMIARSMIIDTSLCLKGEDHYNSIRDHDREVNRIFLLTLRVIRKAVNDPAMLRYYKTTTHALFVESEILDAIEGIADNQKRISRHTRELELEAEDREQLQKMFKKIQKDYTDTMAAFYKGDKESSREIRCNKKVTIEQCNDFLDKFITKTTNKKDLKSIALIIENMKEMHRLTCHIAESSLEY